MCIVKKPALLSSYVVGRLLKLGFGVKTLSFCLDILFRR